ncbi:MAG: helix-turn-helix domain-containing protein [Clostridium beijerinckii]|jgi:excisionase family DNA binding protein|nr:helix-turn-helix domain-containing protein [Clostridium beijerinckii]MCI1580459.1 helix-turn-helix domain-containing protein [Clostridium beijerinckii]MCI1584933.1 helix-turn-helix domain-containing protein [Clostridium beijerinckii]MCI1623734.1 helix-turn-helix domain-containing protein [Clostridium beijerinckii]
MSQVVEKIVITPKEAMTILGVGRNTMYEVLLKDKNFPAFKIGSKFYINKDKLQEWADKQCK